MKKIKAFLLGLAMATGLYAPLELSRLIINYWSYYGLLAPFPFELAIIWAGYFFSYFAFGFFLKEDE